MAQSARTFVGRDSELENLSGLLGVTASGVAADRQHVLLAGDAGVGKTRLLRELRDRAVADGWQVHAGHCVDFGESAVAYMPFSEILDRLMTELPDVVEQVAADYPALARLRPVRRVMGAAPAAATDRGQVFDAVHTLLETAADTAPVLVVVEDVHWADQSTRDLLTYLFTRPFDGPIAVVASYRSDDLHRRHPLRRQVAEWTRLTAVERLTLDPLSDESVRAMVRELAPGRVDTEGVVRRAEGNAFFVEELIQADCGDDLPWDLAEVLLVRLDRLDGAARDIVRTASVAGRRVSHELLTAVTGLPAGELDDALRKAVEENVLTPTGTRYAFRHALLAEAVYDDLLPGERVRLHARFATALKEQSDDLGTAAELALHAQQAGDPVTALKAHVAAGQEAVGVSGVGEAAHHFERALALAADPDVVAAAEVDLDRLVERTGDVLVDAGLSSRADKLLAARLEVVPETPSVGRARLLATRAEAGLNLEQGRGDPLRYSEEAIAALPDGADPKHRCVVLATRTRVLAAYRRTEEAEAAGFEALEIAEKHGLTRLSSDVAASLAWLRIRTGDGDKVDDFREALRQAVEQAKAVGSEFAVRRGLFHLGRSYEETAEFDEALTWFSSALDTGAGDTMPWSPFTMGSRWGIAHIKIIRGEWDEALELVGGSPPDAPHVPAALLDVLRLQIEQARGADVSAGSADLRRHWLDDGLIAVHSAHLDMIAATRAGDVNGLLKSYEDVVEVLSGIWDEWYGARVRHAAVAVGGLATLLPGEPTADWPALAVVAQRLRNDGEQVAAQYDAGEWGPEGQAWSARLEAESLRMRWLAGVDAPAQETLLKSWARAEQLFEAYGDVAELAGVRATYAAILRAAGDLAGSREVADKARETARRLGLRPLLDDLRSLGSTPVRQASTEPSSLTPRESEILTLVAAGRTNGEIGKQLFISTKTVSVHVSNILGKLGASGRTEAAAIARRRRLID